MILVWESWCPTPENRGVPPLSPPFPPSTILVPDGENVGADISTTARQNFLLFFLMERARSVDIFRHLDRYSSPISGKVTVQTKRPSTSLLFSLLGRFFSAKNCSVLKIRHFRSKSVKITKIEIPKKSSIFYAQKK